MKYNISKELFEAVRNQNVFNYSIGETAINFTERKDGKCIDGIFINDFFFECKEWALEQGYQLRSWLSYCACLKIDGIYYTTQEDFVSNSEQQAVFDACMYILEQSKQ